ncbi:MAG: dihydroorotate dehydrogenase, partial [Candidatus Ratteibacteria bacterium]|nr:dihydroorotate dehydrogenase [Candidatus Ratteibacteria bacterium]
VDIKYLDYKKLGAIVTKTITLKPQKGNPQPRIWETSSGMLNCIGLQNPGIKEFISKKMYSVNTSGVQIIVSISGESPEEIKKMTEMLVGKGIKAIELNLSCPNVNRENLMVSQSPEDTYIFVKAAKDIGKKETIIAKLSPNVTDITEIATAAESAGADVLSLINTVKAVAVDVENKRIIEGGLSGPAIKPIGLKAVDDVYKKVKIPLIGIGGIARGQDALEYIFAGASAIGVGSGFFSNPYLVDQIYESFTGFLKENKLKKISDATGLLNEKEKAGTRKEN